jgi:hypothetical protein
VEEVMGVPAMLTVIERLRKEGLTSLVVVHTFIHSRILPLRESPHPMWQHQRFTDAMMEFRYLLAVVIDTFIPPT